jgi:hypothetical protein
VLTVAKKDITLLCRLWHKKKSSCCADCGTKINQVVVLTVAKKTSRCYAECGTKRHQVAVLNVAQKDIKLVC